VAAEKASGVGRTTDIHMIIHGTPGQIVIPVHEKTVAQLEKIRKSLTAREFSSKHHAALKANANFSDRRLRSGG